MAELSNCKAIKLQGRYKGEYQRLLSLKKILAFVFEVIALKL